jgi:hypothetical protein
MSATLAKTQFDEETKPELHNGPFRTAVFSLIAVARTLLQRIAGARESGNPQYIPRRLRHDLDRAEARTTRALTWIFAIARLFSGDTYYLRPLSLRLKEGKRYFLLSKALRAEAKIPAGPATTAHQREVAQLRYLRTALATQPTNKIIRRIARLLNIREDSDDWPAAFLTIEESPAAWANRMYRPKKPKPTFDKPESDPEAEDQTAPKPPFRKRE